jgi:hypothetical protein
MKPSAPRPEDRHGEPSSAEGSRKPYSRPNLVVYGDIREITRTFPTGHGMNEVGTTGADKTGP